MYKVVEVFAIVELKIRHVFGRDSRHISSGRYELNGGLKVCGISGRLAISVARREWTQALPHLVVHVSAWLFLHQEVCAMHYTRCMKALVTFQPLPLMRMYGAPISAYCFSSAWPALNVVCYWMDSDATLGVNCSELLPSPSLLRLMPTRCLWGWVTQHGRRYVSSPIATAYVHRELPYRVETNVKSQIAKSQWICSGASEWKGGKWWKSRKQDGAFLCRTKAQPVWRVNSYLVLIASMQISYVHEHYLMNYYIMYTYFLCYWCWD